jgi:hypothetical protein
MKAVMTLLRALKALLSARYRVGGESRSEEVEVPESKFGGGERIHIRQRSALRREVESI